MEDDNTFEEDLDVVEGLVGVKRFIALSEEVSSIIGLEQTTLFCKMLSMRNLAYNSNRLVDRKWFYLEQKEIMTCFKWGETFTRKIITQLRDSNMILVQRMLDPISRVSRNYYRVNTKKFLKLYREGCSLLGREVIEERR